MSVAPVSTIGPLPISVMPSYPGPSMPVTATRIAPVAEVPVHSTMTSSLPPSFDSVTMVQRMQPPSVPTASTTQSSVARTTSATAPPSATEEQLYMEKVKSDVLWFGEVLTVLAVDSSTSCPSTSIL